jgi:SAM-dependent methyltransferase
MNGIIKGLSRRMAAQAPREPWLDVPELAIDLGCGPHKRPGHVGIDLVAQPGVDYVLDFSTQRLPFDDASVGRIFSSHCLEHLHDMAPLFKEMTRVAAHGARLELWAPYSWHGDAHLNDHVSNFNERQFLHMGVLFSDHWQRELGGRWRLRELVYVVNPQVVADLKANRVELSFALRYFKDVCHELGVIAEVDKSGASDASRWPRFSYAVASRDEQQRVPVDSPRERFWGRVSRRLASGLMSRRGQ